LTLIWEAMMGANSQIEWTHHTFNPVTGCQKVGPGCDNCYAEGWAKRSGLVKWGAGEARRPTSESYWRQPLKWDREAAAAGERRRVFCASLADVFDNAWPDGIRARLWDLIKATPNLDWMLLTKRPGNIGNMLPVPFDFERHYPNVWLGCTVVNQAEADRDIPKLLAMSATVRFLSMEPLLGPVVLRSEWLAALDLVIVGGESGPRARPMHPDWPLSLRDQCVTAGVAFHFKQWGEWAPSSPEEAAGNPRSGWRCLKGHPHVPAQAELYPEAGAAFIEHKGKKVAGRLLEGRVWDQMPGEQSR
jgi:protein gp37